MCYVASILPYYLTADYIYRNGLVRNDPGSDLLWECTRFFMLIGFIFNAVAGNLMLNQLWGTIGCFSTSFLFIFRVSVGFCSRGESVSWFWCGAGFCWGHFLIDSA